MSLQSWKEEFYPVEADDCPKEEAIAHSLRKWIGLRKESRTRHGVTADIEGRYLTEGATGAWLTLGSVSCALCSHYYDHSADQLDDEALPCRSCPLAVSRGGKACDNEDTGKEPCSPWATWAYQQDPEPMIAALEKAASDAEGGAA